MPFASLGLSSELLPAFLRSLAEKGHVAPTPIQSEAIPAILQGRDVLASAQTGSGKTAAFALPLLQQCALGPVGRPRRVQGLVLVPTRELAAQVGETLHQLGKHLPRRVKVVVVFGGVAINPQMVELRGGADIVVATPGRLLDLVAKNAVRLGALSTLVLDEADRLLSLGFGEELGRVLALLPVRRQNLLFSATFPAAIEALASDLLQDPLRIELQSATPAVAEIQQRAIEVDSGRRSQLLLELIRSEGWTRALVFVATKNAAERVANRLYKAGIEAQPFHGELTQGRRNQTLKDFKASLVQVLVATDVAARGVDIAHLPVVVNFDLPRSAVDYTHRIGRTGRAGERGMAVSFVSADTEAHFRLIEKRQGLRVVRERVAGFEPVDVVAPNPADPQGVGGIKGARPSKKDKARAAAALAKAVPKKD